MKGKTLRRTVWCRQRDFESRLQIDAIRFGYHRADWDILSIEDLKKRATWQLLRGKPLSDDPFFSSRDYRLRLESNNIFLATMNESEKFARHYIEHLRRNKELYNPKWINWAWRYDSDSVKIRYRVDRDWEPLGLAVLERDY